ncbi:MAG: GyrI-like domain-containing protein [Anaerolineae bacterium]
MFQYIGEPKIYQRDLVHYMGIRIQTPFSGMFAEVDKLRKELAKWFKERAIETHGNSFLRYHIIDMEGIMDIEYGTLVDAPLVGDVQVKSASLPAGRYASLIYSRYALRGNKALIAFIQDNKLTVDRWDDENGDAFRCRFEMYLTDPKVEHRKSKWDVEIAIKLMDE